MIIVKSSLYAQLPDCQINKRLTSIKYTGNKVIEHAEFEIQINTAKGAEFAEIDISYVKGNNIKELEAGIYDLMGDEIRSLKRKDIIHSHAYSSGQFHGDDMILSFKLIHNRYPYVIKYSYTQERNDYLFLAYWIPRWQKKVPVKDAELTVEVPGEASFELFQQGIDSAKITELSSGYRYQWQAKDIPYVEREKYGPRKEELAAKVIIVPKDFKYGIKGSLHNWRSFGLWMSRLKSNLDLLTNEERAKVHALTQNCATDIEKIKVLYQHLQNNTRYINVALDIGGLMPESAMYVCNNKYGDCKALTNYMQALLKEVGINSIYTLVYADSHPVKIRTDYPSQQFNHVILCVPQANDTIWLECTDSTAPFNYLGTSTQNRSVLLVDGENSKLTRTPSLRAEQVGNYFSTKVTVDDSGEVGMVCTGRAKGLLFSYLKGLNEALSERDKIGYLEDLGLFERCDIQSYEMKRTDSDSAFIDISMEATLNNAVEKIGARLLLKPIRPIVFHLDKPEKRTQELRFDYPYSFCDTIVYEMPKAIADVSGIKSLQFESEYGYYKRELRVEGNCLRVHRQVLIEAGIVPVEEYPQAYAFIKACNNAELQKGIVKYL
ncbi:DUF3857 domain-containing protein [Carboxylicivirga sp. N1E11]|uniref:DUF3857 domain-containing protein n=1 Tax=Carboxylicivirga longa TaxID=3134029 RepID=UPI003D32AAB7